MRAPFMRICRRPGTPADRTGIGDGKPVGGQGRFAVPVQVRGVEVEWAAYAGADQRTSPQAWNPSSQNMASVTLSPSAVRAASPFPSRCARLRSWPPMLAPDRPIFPYAWNPCRTRCCR